MDDDKMVVQSRLRELVAEEVRALLARRRMNGAKLAAAIGRSEMYVSRRLRGETAFDLDDLERIADVLGVAIGKLLPATTDRPNARLAAVAVRPTSPTRPGAGRPNGRGPNRSAHPTSPVPPSRRRPTRIDRPGTR